MKNKKEKLARFLKLRKEQEETAKRQKHFEDLVKANDKKLRLLSATHTFHRNE
jgi:hypothetical protein